MWVLVIYSIPWPSREELGSTGLLLEQESKRPGRGARCDSYTMPFAPIGSEITHRGIALAKQQLVIVAVVIVLGWGVGSRDGGRPPKLA